MNQKSQDKLKRRILYFTGFIFFVIIIRIFFFQIYVVSGNSMAPTLRNGDIVFVSKLGFPVTSEIFPWHFVYSKPSLNRLDIVIFEDQEGEISLKRLVGEPHEYYELNFGKVMIESTILEEDYIPDGAETNEPSNEMAYKYPDSPFIEMSKSGRIPPGYYLLLGDNREYSTDSRSFGFVPLSRLRGKVFATIK
ncbi:signal peptidase I [Leptospira sp. GIMC2001]|uniref:signal peptidase I n=1 Tax=Leptospira sp. GIMC2001 TaxID=1513297 RepID=UPI00234A9A37|nr:signal peptidase I [Leptospira sp. GIMC2001]WCL49319.1 signal peptidase I [Leptospira sp. GIMC2001]